MIAEALNTRPSRLIRNSNTPKNWSNLMKAVLVKQKDDTQQRMMKGTNRLKSGQFNSFLSEFVVGFPCYLSG